MKKSTISRDILLLLALIVEYLILHLLGNTVFSTKLLEVQLLLIYSITIYSISRRVKWYNLILFFLMVFGLFNFMKIFFNIFYEGDIRNVISVVDSNFSDFTYQKILIIYSVFIASISLSSIFLINPDELSWEIKFSNKFFVIGKNLMILCFPAVVYRGYIEVNYLSGQSFTELYIGGASSVPIPSMVRIASVFFQVGFMFLLGSRPSKKYFVIFASLYILSIVPNLFVGLRNSFGLSLLALLWYYLNCFKHQITFVKLIVPSLLIILFFQWLAFFREGSDINTSLLSLIPLFLSYQSTSMYVLALYTEHKNFILSKNYPYILDPLFSWFSETDGQSLETIQHRSSLGHDLVYYLNPEIYLNGMSLGTSLIAELYEFGIFGVIFGAILFSLIIVFFNKYFKRYRAVFISSLFITTYILIAPRSNFLPNFYFLTRYCFVGIFVLLIYNLFKRNNEK